jgi:rare lipoprotein A
MSMTFRRKLLLVSCSFLCICPARAHELPENLSMPRSPRTFSGNISWYGPGFQGARTACGEAFDMNKLSAAHRTLPFQIKVLVEEPRTGKTVIVRINDRGPWVHTRVMDVTREAGRRLGILLRGTAYVDCLLLGPEVPPK